jgi:Plastocyanin
MTNPHVKSQHAFAIVSVLVLAACSAASGPAPTASPAAAATPTLSPSLAPADQTIFANDGGITGAPPKFLPEKVEIKSGGVLRLDDTGTSEHNLTIDTSGLIPTSGASRKDAILISVDLVNTSAEGTINLPPGTYRFYCSIDFASGAGHTSLQGTGMVGTLVVH